MGNRQVCSEVVEGVHVNSFVFDGEGTSTKGKVALSFQVFSKGCSSEVRTYIRAADLDRLGRALIAAAEDIRSKEGE